MKLVTTNKFFLALILLGSSGVIFSFSYDSAIYAAQKGDWQDAHVTLNSIIINNPDDADVLHDAGVTAYKLGDFSQARACFIRSAECAQDDNLRFNSYFKAGNACVDDKDLKEALEQYDKALAIKPDDIYARHNRDRVAQMLQQQEQQKQQKQQKENDQKEDQQENQENKDQQKQDQNKQDQNNKDDQSGNDQDQQQGNDQKNQQGNDKQQGQNKKNDGSDQKSQGDQGNDAEDGDKDAQRKEHGNKQQRQKKPANKQERDGEHELDKKSDSAQSERDKQQGNEHNKAPEKQNKTDNKTNVASAGPQEQGKDEDKHGAIGVDDPWLLNILNNQEEQDKSINKQLVEAKIRQHGGKNGQNCW